MVYYNDYAIKEMVHQRIAEERRRAAGDHIADAILEARLRAALPSKQDLRQFARSMLKGLHRLASSVLPRQHPLNNQP